MKYINIATEWIMKNNLRRWILFLPISIASAFIISIVVDIVINLMMPNTPITHYVFGGLFTGLTFTGVGNYIIPQKRIGKILVYLLIIFGACTIAWYVYLAIKSSNWHIIDFGFVAYLFFIAIGGVVGYSIVSNEK